MLEYVFNSKSKVAILRLLATREDWIFSLSEISRELRMPKNTVKRSIKPLVDYNILREFKNGKSTVFQFNADNYIVKQMVIPLFNTESRYPLKIASEFCSGLKKYHIILAIVFGSVAEGKMTPTSDIDIALISEHQKILKEAANALISKYFKEEGLLFSVHIYRLSEFKKRYAKNDPLMKNIVNGKVIFGDIDKVI